MLKSMNTALEFKGEDSLLTELLSSELEMFKKALESELQKSIIVKEKSNNKIKTLKK